MKKRLLESAKTPWVLAVFGVTVFFTVNGILAYRSADVMAENTSGISNTLNILNLIEETKVHLFRAESGQRGYLITSDEQYLAPYRESSEKLQILLDMLSKSTTEIPSQKERFALMFEYVNEKLQEMADTTRLVSADQDSAAMKIIESDRGFDLSLKIIQLIEEMEVEEHLLLGEKRRISDENHTSVLSALLIANSVGLILALATLYVSFRYSTRIKNLYTEIEHANQELESKVQQRTATLLQYSEELERSNRELEDFAFVASHDLQEPLRKIRAFGDRLSKKYAPVLGEQGQDYIKRMHSASERMSRLIEDLLSFSRVTTRQKPFEPVDLNNMLKDVQDNLEFAISNRSAEIQIDPLPVVDGDASQLNQVFSNLLSNSLKFTAADVTPHIQILKQDADDLSPGADTVSILVKDNGIGFEEQYKDRIFNLFQRLHGRDDYSGTGIGLAICRKIIERHNGKIDVRSTVGEGTQFTITLPLKQSVTQEFPTDELSSNKEQAA